MDIVITICKNINRNNIISIKLNVHLWIFSLTSLLNTNEVNVSIKNGIIMNDILAYLPIFILAQCELTFRN